MTHMGGLNFNSFGGLTGGSDAARGLAMMQSEANFNARVGNALTAAFGGNMVPGPISHLVNRLGDNLTGGGYGNLAGLLPNYVPNADGHGLYFGPGVDPLQNAYFGGYRNQNFADPFSINLGHHADPGFPGNSRGTPQDMDRIVADALAIAAQVTGQGGGGGQVIVIQA